MNPFVVVSLLLAAGLFAVGREWLVLRSQRRQRGLFHRWPIPRGSIDRLDERFVPDALGPTRSAEVRFIGRGDIIVPGGTSDTEAWILAVLATGAPRMFEFGTCTGKTSYLWARNQPVGGRVTTLTLAPDQVGEYQAPRVTTSSPRPRPASSLPLHNSCTPAPMRRRGSTSCSATARRSTRHRLSMPATSCSWTARMPIRTS